MSNVYRYGALLASIACALTPCLRAGDAAKPAPKLEYFTGTVVKLPDKPLRALQMQGEAQPLPILNDDNGRMFYSDAALLGRPMRMTARREKDALRVFQVHSLIKGELHEVYYWCDICTIKRHEQKDCECCGAPMERREEKVK